MIQTPMDVLTNYPVRKSGKQKTAFIEAVKVYTESLGYTCRIEKGSMGCRNILIGDPENAKYLVTAHYDTCAHMFFPNFITPCNLWAYLAYQMLVVGVFLLVSFAVGFGVMLLTDDTAVSFWCGYVSYFVMLALMMFGPANQHNANDNTSGVVTLLEIAQSMPVISRSKVCFVLFDLEEAGLVGSASYRKAHKAATEKQVVLNLDCVGDGDELMMFPTKKLKADKNTMDLLSKICGEFGPKFLKLHRNGFSMYPSDQKNFPRGVGIAAFHSRRGIGLYCSRIHTNRDTVLEQTNVNILRAALTTLICQ